MTKTDGPIFEYACHEGNYGMTNLLSGARAEECVGPGLAGLRNLDANNVMVVLAGLSLMCATIHVRAHHAFAAEFDAKKPIKLEGMVTKVEWINPHAWIHIDVKRPDGT